MRQTVRLLADNAFPPPCAPATLARFSVLSRLKRHENSTVFAKMRLYDGESLKETDPHARTLREYEDAAGVEEGMDGASTRFAFEVLAATFNHDTTEVAADPVHMMFVLDDSSGHCESGTYTEEEVAHGVSKKARFSARVRHDRKIY